MVVEPAAVVLSVTEVPLTLILGAEGLVPWMVIVFVPVSVVLAGAAGTPPVAVAVTVSVRVISNSGRLDTLTVPVVVVPLTVA